MFLRFENAVSMKNENETFLVTFESLRLKEIQGMTIQRSTTRKL